jgi:hypothetical protein
MTRETTRELIRTKALKETFSNDTKQSKDLANVAGLTPPAGVIHSFLAPLGERSARRAAAANLLDLRLAAISPHCGWHTQRADKRFSPAAPSGSKPQQRHERRRKSARWAAPKA